MGQAERMIEFYHGTALVCLGLALVFFSAAAVLFFAFRIPGTLDFLSGRRARRSVRRLLREMEGKQEWGKEPERKRETEREGDETTVFLNDKKTGKSLLGILGIFLGIWMIAGAESLGAESREANIPEAEVQEKEIQEPEDIFPPESMEPEDSLPPEAKMCWMDEEGNPVTEYYNSRGELVGDLAIREEHLDRENTVFYLEASGGAGQKLSSREAKLIDGKSWGQLWELYQEGETEGILLNMEEGEGVYRMRLHFTTEAHYNFSAEIVDEGGNFAGEEGEEGLETPLKLGSFCLDRTPPEIRRGEGPEGRPAGDITWSAGQQTFFRKVIHGLTFGYFCRPVMTVKIGAWDPVSGIASITYEWEGYIGEEEPEFVTLSQRADWENGLREDPEEGKAYTVLELSESFRGVVRATAQDLAGNEMCSWSETVGLLGETEAMHQKSSGLSVEILEGEGKKEGFYRGDVKLKVHMKDTFSGIRKVSLQAGSREEQLCFEEGEELVTEESYEWLLEAADHEGNSLPIRAVLTDFAGHTREPSSLPVIHIDTLAPQVSVEWSQGEAKNEMYYNQDRRAFITVRERNFDPGDVELELMGMECPELVWSHDPGKSCRGSSDPLDLGHGDDCCWRTELVFDQDGTYELGISCRDAAGNEGNFWRTEPFVIDKTPPLLRVEWNHAQARNGKYYGQERKASLVITDLNFRPEDALVEIQDLDKNDGKQRKASVEFRTFGDAWQGEVIFAQDGTFRLLAECMDLAGNRAVPYESEEFVVDQTPPEITFFGVNDHSANRGTAAPGFRIRDVNCDAASCSREWRGTSGRGREPECQQELEPEGLLVRWEELKFLPENDDLYRIRAEAVDLAGNRTEASLSFSVNRFGSVYVLEEETKALAGPEGTFYTSRSPELVVEEYNVDFLEAKRVLCSRDGETAFLTEGKDYRVEQWGTADSWKHYRYRIFQGNFKREGTYLVVLYSEDEASNSSSSAREEKRLEFVVDKTGPDIVIANVEEQGQYQEKSHRVHIDIQDASGLKKAELYRNGSREALWEQEELWEKQGLLTYRIPEEKRWQTLQVRAWDGAGNESVTEKLHVYVTDSRMLQIREGKGLYGAISAVFLICGGIVGAVFARLRRRKTGS